MKKMKKMMMVVMMLLVISLLAVMSFEVKATSDNPITLDNLNITTGGSTTTNQTVNTTTNQTTNTTTNTQGSQVIQPTTNTTTNTNGNTLPQTGVTEDITVMFFIIVCVVSAIFAYKKIRDYRA